MILIGFVMVLVGGIVMPLLMVVKIIPLTSINAAVAWILLFSSYGVSVAGLFLGVIGSAMYMRLRKPPQDTFANDKRNGDGSIEPAVSQKDKGRTSGQ
jgi:hypothetical protein